jgi:16S rRNA pseudouridine516 synthase
MQKRASQWLMALGYCASRREAESWIAAGRLTLDDGSVLEDDPRIDPARLSADGEKLDPAPLTLILHKPEGFVCSTDDPGRLVYDLLPARFRRRDPVLSVAGRLDKDTSGLVLMTDDGQLLHKIISPKRKVTKLYKATLARPLRGDEVASFASGTLMLQNEKTPCKPAGLRAVSEDGKQVDVRLTEGRYHQVRRMMAAVGNHVETLHRARIGGLGLGQMAPGDWRALTDADVTAIFNADAGEEE